MKTRNPARSGPDGRVFFSIYQPAQQWDNNWKNFQDKKSVGFLQHSIIIIIIFGHQENEAKKRISQKKKLPNYLCRVCLRGRWYLYRILFAVQTSNITHTNLSITIIMITVASSRRLCVYFSAAVFRYKIR